METYTEHIVDNSLDAESYFVAKVSATWSWSDNGVGFYEFWGTPGHHEDWGWEYEGYFIEEVAVFNNEEELVVSLTHSVDNSIAPEHEDIWNAVNEMVCEEMESLDPPDEHPEAEYDEL